MKFIKLPTKIAYAEEIDMAEELGTEIDWDDGYVLVNVNEIQEVVESKDGQCSIFYKSGDSTKIALSLDELATLLESK